MKTGKTWKVSGAVVLLALLAVGLAWWEARRRGFRWELFVATLQGLHLGWLSLAAACAFLTYYGRALRWAVLLRPVKPHASIRNLFTATAIGFTAITLLGRPGEFVRPYLIAVKERVPFSSQMAAWLLERIYDLLIALLVFGFALSRVHHSGARVGPALTWVFAVGGQFVAVACAVCLAILLLIRHFSDKMRRRLLEALAFLPEHRFAKAEDLVNAFVQGVESTRSHHAVALLTLYTVLEWVIIAACYLCITKAFGNVLHFNLLDILIFMGFVSFGAVVQIPGVGGGVQVVSVLVLTELFAVPLEVATSMALLVWAITFVVIVPLGLALAFHEGVNWKRLRDLGREVSP